MADDGIYHGRLECDGNGNLLAENGMPVAYHDGSYIYLNQGEPSHNERHEQNTVQMTGTVDESMTDDPSLVNADSENNPHHFEVQPDDPHYEGVKTDPDAIAAKVTGHTDAYTGSEA